jgi:hypothetical protein
MVEQTPKSKGASNTVNNCRFTCRRNQDTGSYVIYDELRDSKNAKTKMARPMNPYLTSAKGTIGDKLRSFGIALRYKNAHSRKTYYA